MDRQETWYSVDGVGDRQFRPGEWLEAGTVLGAGPNGAPVCVEHAGQVVGVQFDVWQQRLILVLQPAPLSRSRRRAEHRTAVPKPECSPSNGEGDPLGQEADLDQGSDDAVVQSACCWAQRGTERFSGRQTREGSSEGELKDARVPVR